MLEGMIGVFVGLLLFGAGVLIGATVKKSGVKSWLKENGCYLCQERYRNHETNLD